MNNVLDKRRAGILLHITSLPSTLGLGNMGRNAYRFVDFLKTCNLSVWQVLPIHPLHRVPTDTPYRDFLSPYQPMSVFAGNPMLINLRKLIEKGWLPRMSFPTNSSDWSMERVFEYRYRCLKDSYNYFEKHANPEDKQSFENFINQHDWLKDYALFCVLKDFYGGACWWDWSDTGHRNHDFDALDQFINQDDHEHCLKQYYFEQFAFFTQWQELKEYANTQGVSLLGDMPFFVARDSVEVWAHREYFQLDEQGIPLFLSGFSPQSDYFQPDNGQCWGHPLYNWAVAAEENFQWWLKRFGVVNDLFDMVRLTYFQGFQHCWAIPNETPINFAHGGWQSTTGRSLFIELLKQNLSVTLIAEDIGVTDEVVHLRNEFRFLGIKLLQLAFDTKKGGKQLGNYHLPHNHLPRDVVYTGTHDSDTAKSWFFREHLGENQEDKEKRQNFVCSYLDAKAEDMPFPLIRAAFQSSSKLAMIPMQDLLSLGKECRMNTPGTSNSSNWRWQLQWLQITQEIEQKVKDWVERYERN